MENKIDKHDLGSLVLKYRKTMTCNEVADALNRKYIPENEPQITKLDVSRYCTRHGLNAERMPTIASQVKSFDSLSEAYAVRKRIEKHVNKLGNLVDEVKEDEEKLSEIGSISNAYLNACKQLQSLNESVSRIQKEQLSIEKVRTCVKLLVKILRKYPEVYNDFMIQLREREEYDVIRSL